MRKLSFCFGSSRQAAVWRPAQMDMEELLKKLQTPIRTDETTAQYHDMTKAERDVIKDKGGFLAGKLKGARRKKTDVVSRSMITLDCDKLTRGFFDSYEDSHCFYAVVYTTHSHMPEAPRARILMPLTRDVTPEEYNAIARYLAEELGMEMIDPCSFKINQLMYWPNCASDGEYICRVYDGEWLDPDAYLAAHPDWRNCAELPTAPAEREERNRQHSKQEDPLTKTGIVGTFCRAYTIAQVIEKYLSHVYAPTDKEERYDYIPGEGSSGVVVYEDKFVYSHHATDPAGGKLLNAFDLVRVHLFDEEDPRKSFDKMAELAAGDERVQTLGLQERTERASEEFSEADESDDWKSKLVRQKKTTLLENSLYNLKLIMQNDRYLKNIVFNELADGMEIRGEVPWNHPAKYWRDADDAQLICYVDDHYGTFSARNYEIAVSKTVDDRSYHPIREMFRALPPWDGECRADTLLVDYLGAEDNVYVRAVTRKTLCAAVRRVQEPGIKFDTMLVLNGPQGIGKSTLIARLAGEWFSDSLNLGDTKDKTAAEKLQGYWILEIGELAGLRKAEVETLRSFLSRQNDIYRAAFGHRATPHPRQCIFFGTTNAESGYLRDTTGNRRFWPVKTPGGGSKHSWDITTEEIEQIWAEVLVYVKAGEKLYLSPSENMLAKDEQRNAMESDDEREGLVRMYLDTLLPEDWDSMDLYGRRAFLSGTDGIGPVGTVTRKQVSNIEIWCECFGKERANIGRSDSNSLAAILSKLGWERLPNKQRIPLYGPQIIYVPKGCS